MGLLVLRPAGSRPSRLFETDSLPDELERSGYPDTPRRALRSEQAIKAEGSFHPSR